MKLDLRTLRLIIHLKIRFTQRGHDTSIWTDYTVQQSYFHQESCRHYRTV